MSYKKHRTYEAELIIVDNEVYGDVFEAMVSLQANNVPLILNAIGIKDIELITKEHSDGSSDNFLIRDGKFIFVSPSDPLTEEGLN